MDKVKKYIYKQVAGQKMTKEEAKELLLELQEHPGKEAERDKVAIIGMSLRFPDADTPQQYWSNLCAGRRSIKDFPKLRERDDFGSQAEGKTFKKGGYLDRIDTFDAGFFHIAPSEAKYMNPLQRVFLELAYEAVEDAGYAGSPIRRSRTGVYVGVDHTSKPDYPPQEHKKNPLAVTGSWTGILASRVSYVLNLRGPSMVVDTACSSGLVAVHTACKAIQNQECEMAIAGGICLELKPAVEDDELSMVASKDDRVRTFDRNANGTVWGEGVGVVLLKPLKKAIQDKDHIYAVIAGSAVNNDGTSNGITAPDAEAQEDVLVAAWEDAGVQPESIGYMEAHGTGTVLGDPIEVKGLTQAFGRYTRKKQFCGIGSVKTNIGHTVGASGMASLLKVVLSLKEGVIPATLNFEEPNRYISFPNSPFYVVDRTREWRKGSHPRRAGVSAFGFSGTNCHMVVEEATIPLESRSAAAPYGQGVITLSAASREGLLRLLGKYQQFLAQNEHVSREALCFTANTGREHRHVRLAILFQDIPELRERLASILQKGLLTSESEGIFYGGGLAPAKGGQSEKLRMSALAKQWLQEEGHHGGAARLKELCQWYVRGAEIPWEEYYKGLDYCKISLPTYPFEAKRYWLDQDEDSSLDQNARSGFGATEAALWRIWSEVLETDHLGLDDDFYELGGNSILSLNIEVRMLEQGMEVTATDLMRYPTLRKLAAYVDGSRSAVTGADQGTDASPDTSTDWGADTGTKADAVLRRTANQWEPFNEVFYKYCFYNSLFPVVFYAGGSITPFLANDVLLYAFDKSSSLADSQVSYRSVKSVKQILDSMGMTMVGKSHSTDQPAESEISEADRIMLNNYGRDLGLEDEPAGSADSLLEELREAMLRKHPVILWVDCFYSSRRRDTYQIEHWPHALLLLDYDAENGTFLALEHDKKDSLNYKRCSISQEDVLHSYKGFLAHYKQHTGLPAFITFPMDPLESRGLVEPSLLEQDTLMYARNLLEAKEEVGAGLPKLERFFSQVKEWISSEECLQLHVKEMIEDFNGLIDGKKVDKFRSHVLFGPHHSLTGQADAMVEQWSQVRSILTKYYFSANYAPKKISEVDRLLGDILQAEHVYYQALISQMDSIALCGGKASE
ncbi:beta-ketoacyl synthase N-terminal-like domain-containing protein [Gorillibacterium sp. sgz500922]|uniref:beta-ketoacyl synthase N-terminal-like domain-containing protein n=1 Tax=Gorillibacterium sp. sgz500922 TaxID=3446694 RepID=UPI003F67C980